MQEDLGAAGITQAQKGKPSGLMFCLESWSEGKAQEE